MHMDWAVFATIVGTGIAVTAFLYQIIRNFKEDVNKLLKSCDERFEKHERRFELLEQRMFLLAMGKSLPDILKQEKETK